MLEHGGNIALASIQYGIPLENWLDLSTGINPDGYPIPDIPPSAWQRLPIDDDLVETACAYYGCKFALPTAGSQAAIQMLPKMRSASKIAMPSLMYQEHSRAWQRNGHEVIEFESYPDENIIKHADVVLLCNPNNPTSTRFNNSELLRWRTQLTERGGWLIVDEAFMDATPELSIAQHAHLEGLFVLRSLGKFFGLAGARVGFLLGSEKALIAAQEEIGPWSIPGPSRSIAEQALKNKAWQQATRINLSENSQRLIKMLTLYDLAPSAGTTLFQFKSVANAEVWHHHFAKQGIWVRLFREESALRFGLPPSFGWGRLENALKSFKHTS